MKVKECLKRTVRYIFHGIPVINISVGVGMIDRGKCLQGKKVLITGGGRGLGLAMAERCMSEGAAVIITGRSEETLQKASDKLQHVNYEVLDISDINSIPLNMDKIIKKYGMIDCLINNAGISLHEKNMQDVTVAGFESQFRTNLEGAYFLTQEFIKRKKENCNIIFLSSERGAQCDDVPYGLTKASINSLTRGLSRRFYKNGVRVNAIAPGITASDMTGRKADDNMYEEGLASGRFFIPEEVAEVAIFLLSDASKCISGEVINCDAGNYISSYY